MTKLQIRQEFVPQAQFSFASGPTFFPYHTSPFEWDFKAFAEHKLLFWHASPEVFAIQHERWVVWTHCDTACGHILTALTWCSQEGQALTFAYILHSLSGKHFTLLFFRQEEN
ncbi:hypothetical protein GGP41_001081 [Bipolaris sorokiniana]|uniref:Uncharacterized protein n=1 Tax=Cochliobolus sativus TaxID=45130 RepID=A0A8H5Z9D9_COCSA|nr:hypothetical protein GGP41_001081 [Bipolaris sorokiniana]